jgi:hypothetical protein
MANRRGHAGKVDANQESIVDVLRFHGVIVRSLAGVGDGMNDLLCVLPDVTFLIECKEPGEKLTPKQKDWHRECPYRNHIAYSAAEAVEIAMFYRTKGRKNGRD